MKIIKKAKVEQPIIVDITCDCCGKSTKTDYGFVCMNLEAYWGYMSNHDLQKWEAQICEQCVEENFSFIKFDKSTYIPS